MRKIKFIILLSCFGVFGDTFGQIGINTVSPDNAAILELKDNERGFLLPRMNTTARLSMKNNLSYTPIPEGLLVYDLGDDFFYFYNPSNSANDDINWQGLSPFIFKDLRNDFVSGGYMRTIETHRSVQNLNLLGNTAFSVTRRTHIKGQLSISATNTAPPAPYGLYAQGNSSLNNGLNVTGTVTSTGGFVGKGTVPIGTIIMWSGSPSNLPAGYALCDGTAGRPDLRGRFVVAAGSSAPHTMGGQNEVELTDENLPSHSHLVDITGVSIKNNDHRHTEGQNAQRTGPPHLGTGPFVQPTTGFRNTGRDGGGVRYYTTEDGAHSHTLSLTGQSTEEDGNGDAIDNRPHYFVLAFIIRIN